MPQRVSEHGIIARQSAQLCARRLVKVAKYIGCDAGGQPVGFREHNIECDHDGAHFSQSGDEIGDARARPRPLAYRIEAFFVDIGNDDWSLRCVAGVQYLEKVEDAYT